MKQYCIHITDKALADMASIYDYIATVLLSPEVAMRQYNRIADGIQSLQELPERCRLFDSQPERDMGMRCRIVDNYSAVYVVREETVV